MAVSTAESSADMIEAGSEPTLENGSSVSPREPGARGLTVFLVVSVLLALAATAFGTVLYFGHRDFENANARDARILDTARQVSVNLVTLRYATAQEDLDRILGGTTGSFRDQFTDVSGSFTQVLAQGQVESTGEVKSVGLVEADDRKATVLAAVTSTVKNTEAPDGDMRSYRMKVSLENVDSSWLVSNVEFVP